MPPSLSGYCLALQADDPMKPEAWSPEIPNFELQRGNSVRPAPFFLPWRSNRPTPTGSASALAGCQRLGKQWPDAVAASINSYQRVCQAGQQRCTLRLYFQTRFKLRLGFLRFVDTQQCKPISNTSTSVLRQRTHGIFMKCQSILPDIVMAIHRITAIVATPPAIVLRVP